MIALASPLNVITIPSSPAVPPAFCPHIGDGVASGSTGPLPSQMGAEPPVPAEDELSELDVEAALLDVEVAVPVVPPPADPLPVAFPPAPPVVSAGEPDEIPRITLHAPLAPVSPSRIKVAAIRRGRGWVVRMGSPITIQGS